MPARGTVGRATAHRAQAPHARGLPSVGVLRLARRGRRARGGRADRPRRGRRRIYAVALAGMFGASALYHRVAWRPSLAPWFRRLDHSMIFVLIAGTSTPVIVLGLEGVLPVVVLAVCGSARSSARCSTSCGSARPGGSSRRSTSCSGWVGVVLLPETARHVGIAPALLFIAGGALYTAGAVIYMRQRPDPRRRSSASTRSSTCSSSPRRSRTSWRSRPSSSRAVEEISETRRRAPRPTRRTTAAGGR